MSPCSGLMCSVSWDPPGRSAGSRVRPSSASVRGAGAHRQCRGWIPAEQVLPGNSCRREPSCQEVEQGRETPFRLPACPRTESRRAGVVAGRSAQRHPQVRRCLWARRGGDTQYGWTRGVGMATDAATPLGHRAAHWPRVDPGRPPRGSAEMDLSPEFVRDCAAPRRCRRVGQCAGRELLDHVRRAVVVPVVRRSGLRGPAADQAEASGWEAAWDALRRPTARTAENPGGMVWVAVRRAVAAETEFTRMPGGAPAGALTRAAGLAVTGHRGGAANDHAGRRRSAPTRARTSRS